MVSSGLVVPGNPNSSQLYIAISTGVMPQGGMLSSADITTIQQWILDPVSSTSQSPASPSSPANPSANPPPTPTPTPTPAPTGGGTQSAAATYTQVAGLINTYNCSSCHGGQYSSYSGLASIVDSSTPTQTTLYKALTGNGITKMPKGGPYMSSADLATVLSWLTAGAPNN